jgi:molybdopterin-guanine dinucleotide biosynthesis protein A
VASEKSLDTKPEAFENTEPFHCLVRVMAARRMKPANSAGMKKRRNSVIQREHLLVDFQNEKYRFFHISKDIVLVKFCQFRKNKL